MPHSPAAPPRRRHHRRTAGCGPSRRRPTIATVARLAAHCNPASRHQQGCRVTRAVSRRTRWWCALPRGSASACSRSLSTSAPPWQTCSLVRCCSRQAASRAAASTHAPLSWCTPSPFTHHAPSLQPHALILQPHASTLQPHAPQVGGALLVASAPLALPSYPPSQVGGALLLASALLGMAHVIFGVRLLRAGEAVLLSLYGGW